MKETQIEKEWNSGCLQYVFCNMTVPKYAHLSRQKIRIVQEKLDIEEAEYEKHWCFWTSVLEKASENTMDIHENKLMAHWTNQPRTLTHGTNDQAQIIVLWSNNAKTQLSEKDPNAGKVEERKEDDDQQQDKWIQFKGNECTVLKLVIDHQIEKKFYLCSC